MNEMHKHNCQCGNCETPQERVARDNMESERYRREFETMLDHMERGRDVEVKH